jgi:hypothetical protein
MLPINLDGLFPGVCQDDELRRPVVVMGAKAHDVNLSHSGRKIGKKPGQSKGGGPSKEQKREASRWTLFYLASRSKPGDVQIP